MKSLFSLLFIIIFLLPFGKAGMGFAQAPIVFDAEPENLGSTVNSEYSEISPTISPDGKTLFITRYPPDNGDKNNIWVSYLQTNGEWTLAKNIGTPLNVPGSSTSVQSVTPDGNTILLSNLYKYFDGSITGGGCSISSRQRGGWSFPKGQVIEKYENLNQYVNYYLSNSGQYLLMAIEKKKGFGEKDLYVSFKTTENNWSVPKNLGNIINTKAGEFGPFLAADDKTLYFVSSGHPGYGDADVWMSKRLDDTWTNWSNPVNLGEKINSSGFDAYFSIDAAGEYAYFTSTKNSYGSSDIFRIKMPTAAKPDPVVLIYGKVIDQKTNEPIKAKISYEQLPSGKEVGTAVTSPEDMVYKIVLPFGENYGFMAAADNYYSITQNLDLSKLEAYQEMEVNLYLATIQKDEAIRLNNIFFEFGKSVLKEESFPELNRLVKLLTDNPAITIEINGHTDDVGADADNLKLSQDRAAAVVTYLSSKKIAVNRLSSNGFGETKPIANNKTEEGRQLNRHVEFVVKTK
ncbi:MAG: flagellar motor protein MotB [Flavobacteriales bacterium CG18_big_fil_WC_8_21_14_2_50_32_9]|nr:MAG: flagellar motor protein MotB [Flavobacteriales bacterium CG18_big_fil_WC_8_21_14_2_50_32_9]PJC62351.1 MAG: flagellar motor protein MotB [Flavobacteriales bacterium CG_4_9_14_0_2_um_filter_32_27]